MAVGSVPIASASPRRPLGARVRTWFDQERVLGPAFVTPAVILLVLLVAYPFCMALYFAVSNAFIGRPSHFVGLRNFVNLWQSDAFRQTFQNASLCQRLTKLRSPTKRSEEHTSELQSRLHLVCRLLLEKKK